MIRRNRITGDPLFLAPGRAARPNAFRNALERCPFCPGAESDTPPEIWRDGDPWSVRVVPNKYPATERHEIVIEAREHEATFDLLSPDHAARVVNVWVERYGMLQSAGGWTCIFKNQGQAAGASMPHLHSQLLATPFIPPRIAREASAFRAAARCPLCSLDDEPLIAATANFRWIAPRGSSMACEQWIVPRTHGPEVAGIDGLAALLQQSTRAMHSVAGGFNWMFLQFPGEPAAHWYVQILPRTSVLAGFELASGSAINAVEPERVAAEFGRFG